MEVALVIVHAQILLQTMSEFKKGPVMEHTLVRISIMEIF